MDFQTFQNNAEKLYAGQWKPRVMLACGVGERTIDRWRKLGVVPVLAESWIKAELKSCG